MNNIILNGSEKIKKRYKILNIQLKKENEPKWHLIKCLILIENLKKGYRMERIYMPNRAGCGIVFSLINSDEEFQIKANQILNIYNKYKKKVHQYGNNN